jgi:hypothetical protein
MCTPTKEEEEEEELAGVQLRMLAPEICVPPLSKWISTYLPCTRVQQCCIKSDSQREREREHTRVLHMRRREEG